MIGGNSGTGGAFFDREGYEDALASLRETIDNTEVVGFPKRDTELRELRRLVTKYPDETRKLLDGIEQV